MDALSGPAQIAEPAGRREQQRGPGPPAVLPSDDRDQGRQADDGDESGGGGPGQAGQQAQNGGRQPATGEQRVQCPHRQGCEHALGVGHRLGDRVRDHAPQDGEDHPCAVVVQPAPERVQPPGRRDRAQPGERHGGGRVTQRGDGGQAAAQLRVEREEGEVALQRVAVIVTVLDDAQVPDRVPLVAQLVQQALVLRPGPVPQDPDADEPHQQVAGDRGDRRPRRTAQGAQQGARRALPRVGRVGRVGRRRSRAGVTGYRHGRGFLFRWAPGAG